MEILSLSHQAILVLSMLLMVFLASIEQASTSLTHGNSKNNDQNFGHKSLNDLKSQLSDLENSKDIKQSGKENISVIQTRKSVPGDAISKSGIINQTITSMNPRSKLASSQNESDKETNITLKFHPMSNDRLNIVTQDSEPARNIRNFTERPQVTQTSIIQKPDEEDNSDAITNKTMKNTVVPNGIHFQDMTYDNRTVRVPFVRQLANSTNNSKPLRKPSPKSKLSAIILATDPATEDTTSSYGQTPITKSTETIVTQYTASYYQTHLEQSTETTGTQYKPLGNHTDNNVITDIPRQIEHRNNTEAITNTRDIIENKPSGSVEDKQQAVSQVIFKPLSSLNKDIKNKNTLSKEGNNDTEVKENAEILKVQEAINKQEVNIDETTDIEGGDSTECPTCTKIGAAEENVKAMRLLMFEQSFVQKLRLNISERNELDTKSEDHMLKLPPAILEQELKDNSPEFEKEEFYAQDQEIIITGKDMGRNCSNNDEVTGCYSFDLTGKVQKEVEDAELWFYKMKDGNDIHDQIFKVFELFENESGNVVPRTLIARLETNVKDDWVSVNVTSGLKRFIDTKRKQSIELAITCSTCSTESYTALFGAKNNYKPLLMIKYATSNQLSRSKRSENCDPRHECCKRELTVNFNEIGLQEIIEPRNLSIGYCFGDCNEIHHGAYNHTRLRQRSRWNSFHNQPTMRLQLKPCCVPMILRDAFVMTMEGANIRRVVVPKVVAESCGCM